MIGLKIQKSEPSCRNLDVEASKEPSSTNEYSTVHIISVILEIFGTY